ncbi:zincin-like metallopeptidase domain-containing protein [Hoylesella timonensis]|uniref:zincin-like metallopeptidase domain-containing protein n=1 Tax=Hoylesella timonensis TaxID=386414 RepID=UPI003F49827D
MMVKIIETAKANNWKKGWMGVNGSVQGLPQNISGRTYSGGNSFFLMFNTAEQGYKTPVYMTFLQAKDQNLQVKPGEKSVPVFKWGLSIKDEDGNKISEEVYNTMSKEERSKLIVRPFPRVFSVFNIDQTNLEEVNKKKYDAIVARFKVPEQEVKDTDGMYVNEALDRMFETKAWYAKIQYDKPSEQAFYRPSTDTIVLPMKSQFKLGQTPEEVYRDGMEYYSTALHEMAHSTGHEDRLNRSFGQHGTDNYAHEELIAEMTSALVGSTMGFDRKILENNANYLSGWLNRLKSKPETISTIMTDVGKASDMIIDKIDEQRIALNQKPLKAGNLEGIDGELAQTKERGKTLYDLQKKYSRINGQYPASADDDRTRQIAKRIRQAEQIIMAYNANVVSVYGEQFVFSTEAQTRIIPQAIYSGRERPVLETKEENISSDEKPQKSEDMKVQVSTAPFTREIPTWETYEKEKGKDGDFTYQETAEEYGKTLLNGVEDILPRVKGTIYMNQWGEKSLTAKIDGLVEVFVSRYIPDTLSAWVDAMPKEETHVNMQSSYTSKSVDIAAAYIFSALLSQKEGQQITLSFSDDKQSWKTIDEVYQAKQEGLLSVVEFEALSALESSKGIPEEGIIPNAISTLKNRVRNSEYFGYDLKEGVKEAIDILESGKITAAYTVTDKHEEAQTVSLPNPEELDKSPQKEEEVAEMSSLSEDSNPATNVAGIAEKIMEGGHVSKEVAEKKAAVIAEAQQSAVEEKKQKIEQAKQTAAKAREDERRREVEEQKRREEENRREEKDSGYTSKIFLHAALLLGALELAKGNKGIWMNKAGKSNAEFLWAKTPITPYNNLMMNLQSDQKGYRSNVYAYFDELKNVGDSVKTNEKALPFNWTRWDYQNIATKDVITKGEYQGLPEEEKSLYVKHHTRQTQQIFNIDQTSLTGKEMYSDLLKETGAKYEELSERGVTNMINYSEKLKSNHPTAIVVARNDNQYHIYGNDATRAGKILGLPVGQTEANGQKIKSTGFPLDRIDDYLPKLVQAKQWVVVADNLDSSELIKRVANEKDVLNKAYSTAQKVAKSAGIGYERVMVLQDAEYDKQADKIIVSGMMDKNSGNSRQAAIAKANDIYRAIVAATGSEQRLDRMGRNNLLPNDDAKYERFVQDLSAGILMARQGLPASLSKESMQHIDYWKREIKENPKLLGLLEKDVNNAVESIDKHMQKQLVKYEEIRKDLPLKDLAVSERQYQISTDLSKLPDIDSKEIVIVRDTAKGSADVILPEGASLEDNVEISGIRKDRIKIALGHEGITDVKFYNAGGALGLKEPDDYYKDKTVSVDRLKQYEFSQHRDIDVKPQIAAAALPKIEIFTPMRDEKGQWAFFFKAEKEPSFAIYPNDSHKKLYFDVRGTDRQQEIHQALAQKYYAVAKAHPEIKVDLIMPKVPNVDISKIERPTITKDRENPDKKYVMATVDGKFMKKEISKQRWDRMWLADDMSAYKKAIAAVAFAPFLKENVQTEKSAENGKQSVENGQQESDMKENKVEGTSQSSSEKEEENQSNLKQKVRSLHLN